MRFGKALCVAGLIGFGALGTALADNVTFNATGSFDDTNYQALSNAVLGGTLVIDTVAGVVEAKGLDLTVTGGFAGTPGLVFDTLDTPGGQGYFFDGTDNIYYVDATDSNESGPVLQLEFDIGSNKNLAGFTGGALCYVASDFPNDYPGGDNCGYYYSSYQLSDDPELTGGSLSAAPSGTPEPKSWLLLAGPAAWLMFRQRRKAQAVKIR